MGLVAAVAAGDIPARGLRRVDRIERDEADAFIEARGSDPGTLEHLYPKSKDGDD